MDVTCQKLQFTPIDGRTVRLTGDFSECEVDKDNGKIVALRFDGYAIEANSTISVKNSRFKVNKIITDVLDGSAPYYDLMTADLTTASTFVMPFMGGNRRLFMWNRLFVNAFVGTDEDEDCIALLYRYSSQPEFLKFENTLEAFRHFRVRREPDPYHTIFVFNVPDKARTSYAAFLRGRYSEIDDEWKLRIIEFHDFHIDGHTGRVLFQSPWLKAKIESELDVELDDDAELLSRPDMKREIYSREYYSPSKPVL